MQNQTLLARKNRAVGGGVGVQTSIFVDKAKNAELWDAEGDRYIDFAAGIAVVNTGHCNPVIVKAIQKQLESFVHTCHQVVPYENYVLLAEKLNALVKTGEENQTIFVSTGAEAVENAVKIARASTKRHGVIAFEGGFHGRTFMTMSLTGKIAPYKQQFGPMMNGVYHVPFPSEVSGIRVEDSLRGIEHLFKCDISPQDVAAIIIEPVQGEGGFRPAPPALLQALRKICDTHGIVLIADEIQTGFARTGEMFAMDHHNVHPDLTTMAKGLAAGVPLAAVTGKKSLMEKVSGGGLGGTYGGNPLGIASALAVLEVIEKEKLCERTRELGDRLERKLKALREHTPQIADIRGPGMMKAVEFFTADGKTPDAAFAKRVQTEAFRRKLILLTCGVHGNVIRFLAPLTIEDSVFEEALGILEEAVRNSG